MTTLNLFEKQLDTARQNIALTRESLAESLVAAQRNPNDAEAAETVEQLERELTGWEQKLKRAEIAASYTAQEQDAETIEARREQQQESARSAHELLIREHRSYTDGQINLYRALAGLAGNDLQIVQARLNAFCISLAKAATRGVRFEHERASEKYTHVSFFLLGDDLPEIKDAGKAIANAERNHERVKAWADRSLAEALAAVGLPAWTDTSKRA
jgi:hypothetical protein